jgi:hypothetical protein
MDTDSIEVVKPPAQARCRLTPSATSPPDGRHHGLDAKDHDRDDIDGLDVKNGTGRHQKAHVDDLVGHGLFDNHLMLPSYASRRRQTPTFVWAAIARLSGPVNEIWLSPVR